jgi:glycerol-3-phosphate dehydrogenase (NAD(P)+)
MATIAILGAGYMGSALAVVAAGRGHAVRLWGTWLDDDLVAPVLRGEEHPRLRLRLPAGISAHHHPQLAEALRGAEAVVCAVNSDGVLPVLERAVPHLPAAGPLLSVTKGFLPDEAGQIARISEVVRAKLLRPAGKDRPFVHIGGPCKAMEVARGVNTAVVHAADGAVAEDVAARDRWADALETDFYTVTRSDDLAGVETCSAFKNAYATASGLCDGLQLTGHPELYNTKAMMFARAIAEVTRVVEAMGGRPGTAGGQAGVGDLHVTAAAGRNRTYGEHVGRGEPPDQVAERMRATGELTEGYPALHTGRELVNQLAGRGLLRLEDFPLLTALHAIVYEGADVAATLAGLRIRDDA